MYKDIRIEGKTLSECQLCDSVTAGLIIGYKSRTVKKFAATKKIPSYLYSGKTMYLVKDMLEFSENKRQEANVVEKNIELTSKVAFTKLLEERTSVDFFQEQNCNSDAVNGINILMNDYFIGIDLPEGLSQSISLVYYESKIDIVHQITGVNCFKTSEQIELLGNQINMSLRNSGFSEHEVEVFDDYLESKVTIATFNTVINHFNQSEAEIVKSGINFISSLTSKITNKEKL